MRSKKWSPMDSLNHDFFWDHEQWLIQSDGLLYISKRIKLNKNLAKKGVGMGVWEYVC